MRTWLTAITMTSLLVSAAWSCEGEDECTDAQQKLLAGYELCGFPLAPDAFEGCACTRDAAKAWICQANCFDGDPCAEGDQNVALERLECVLDCPTVECVKRPFGAGGEGGVGGTHGSGGMGGSGHSGGAGGSGGTPGGIAPHTVLSGTPTYDENGCVVAEGESVTLVFNQPLDGAKNINLAGITIPDPNSNGGPDGVGIMHVCIGGVLGTTSVTDCYRARIEHNTFNLPTSVWALFDGSFNPLDETYWTPASTDPQTVVQQISVDPTQGTLSASCTAGGNDIGTVTASNLSSFAGDVISIFMRQAKLCAFGFSN